MHRTRTRSVLLLLCVVALLAASCGGRDDDDNSSGGGGGDGGGGESESNIDTSDCPDNGTAGIDGDTITLASSFPQSGLTAAFAQISKGYKAYFAKLNADGGVEVDGKKYKIEVVDKDDEYNSAKTIQNIDELVGVDGEKAFAVFNVVGTANNLAIRESLHENCVPNVFAATGSPAWGNPDYPWLIGSSLAPYTVEAKAFADYLAENDPDAKVGMLIQDDDFGDAYREGFEKAIEGTDITVVGVETYPTGGNEVSSQVTSLAASGADTFFNGSTLLACPQALTDAAAANWTRENTFVSGTCISKTLMGLAGADAEGVIAVTNTKDPLNPAYADDEAMQEYLATLEEYAEDDVDPENGIVAYGYVQADLLVQALENSDELTRVAFMDSIRNMDGLTSGLMVDGAEANTGEDDNFMVENVQLVKYNSAGPYFENVGEVLDFEGQTAEVTPADLIES